jgi:SMODS-associated and fused to various effectors sensor domain/CHAT domain
MTSQKLQRPITILLFSANPSSSERLRIDREFREIARALRAEEQSGAVKLMTRTAGRTEDLRDALLECEPHIVHFSGHGTAKEEIILEESEGEARRVSKQALAQLFGILKDRIRVVLLNACHSMPLAEAIAEHVEFAIGMNNALTDKAAIDFSLAFYKAIAHEKSIRDAFELARNALDLKGSEDADVPALITRPAAAPISPVEPAALVPLRKPVQVLFLLDVISDNPLALEDIERHLPDERSERYVLTLSQFGARKALRGLGIDFPGCADALARMVAEARRKLEGETRQVRYYVAGRAPLPVFAHLGMELSAWSDVTLINQRKDLSWDVLPLKGRPASGSAPYFKIIKGVALDEPSEADGRVAIFISTGHTPQRAELHAFLRACNSAIAGFIEVSAGQNSLTMLDESNVAQAMNELAHIFAKLPDDYPRRKGIAIFIAGPATLAYMVGRAINVHPIQDVWVPNFEGGVYRFSVSLPWKSRTQPEVSEGAESELGRKRMLEVILGRIQALQKSLTSKDLPPTLSAEEATKFLARLSSIQISREPQGSDFELNTIEGTMVFGKGLLEALRPLSEADLGRVGQSFFLHELFHFNQNLHAATHAGVGRAGVALEEVDYWADALAVATLASWEIRRGGEEGKEKTRSILVAAVDAVLAGIEAFDRFEQGERMDRLPERRLRRYLIWHMQRARALTTTRPEDIRELLGKRLIVELAPLRGHLDERFDKIADAPQDDAELFVVLDGRLLRSRHVTHSPNAIIEATRTFDRKLLGEAMRSIREQHLSELVPWNR